MNNIKSWNREFFSWELSPVALLWWTWTWPSTLMMKGSPSVPPAGCLLPLLLLLFTGVSGGQCSAFCAVLCLVFNDFSCVNELPWPSTGQENILPDPLGNFYKTWNCDIFLTLCWVWVSLAYKCYSACVLRYPLYVHCACEFSPCCGQLPVKKFKGGELAHGLRVYGREGVH
jgi:hypothetical protein